MKKAASALVSCLFLLTMTDEVLGQSKPERTETALSCSFNFQESKISGLGINCDFINHGSDAVLLLPGPLTLEGPGVSGEEVYFPLGNFERFENVLEFERGVFNLEGRGELADPQVHLSTEDLHSLVKVEGRTSCHLEIRWDSGLSFLSRFREGLTVRVKVIFILAEDFSSLESSEKLTPSCRNELFSGMSGFSACSAPILLPTRLWPGGDRDISDGCHDYVSWEFRQLFSNQMYINGFQGEDH